MPEERNLLDRLKIPGLNVAIALARYDNDEEAYLILLEAFKKHASRYVGNIKSFIESQAAGNPALDIDSYRIAVHSLKGSNRSIGAEEFGDMAEKLEVAARENDLAFIAANSGPFIEVEEGLIAALEAFFDALPKPGESKPPKDAPDLNILAALKQAAETYDMGGLKDAIDALDAYTYPSLPDFAQKLKDMAGRSDFEAIAKQLAAV